MIKIGITQGDINGVGYEVIIKTLEDTRMLELFTPVIYGSAKIAHFYCKAIGMANIQLNQIADPDEALDGAINIINVVDEDVKPVPGELSAEAGNAAFAALSRAVADAKERKIDAIVTAPISKNSIQSDDFAFPGHTEYLADQTGAAPLMILFDRNVRIALVTTHLPVGKIAEAITVDTVVDKIKLLNNALVADFGIVKPRVAVLSLNPHAGEEGLLGSEENEVIIPAIAKAADERINCFGPYAADGFFGSGQYAKFDGVLAMYHDQGLAPFKTIAMDRGVNYTAGLPIVRTSPDHGTAFDIAGKGLASETSMREAIYAAIDIVRNRRLHADRTRNPLRRQYFDKSKDNVVLDLSKDD